MLRSQQTLSTTSVVVWCLRQTPVYCWTPSLWLKMSLSPTAKTHSCPIHTSPVTDGVIPEQRSVSIHILVAVKGHHRTVHNLTCAPLMQQKLQGSLSAPFKASPPVFGLNVAVQKLKHMVSIRGGQVGLLDKPPPTEKQRYQHRYSYHTSSSGRGQLI